MISLITGEIMSIPGSVYKKVYSRAVKSSEESSEKAPV